MANEIITILTQADDVSYSSRIEGGQSPRLANEDAFGILIRADSDAPTRANLLATPGLPGWITLYEGQFPERITFKLVSYHARLWRVDYTFSTRISEQEAQQAHDGTPLENLRPEYEWLPSEIIEEVQEVDPITGEPIVNAVQEPLLQTAPRSIPVLQITRYATASPSGDTRLAYENHVNSEPFWGAPPYGALLTSITDRKGPTIGGTTYRQLTYIIKFNNRSVKQKTYSDPDFFGATEIILVDKFIGWRRYLLNQGSKYLALPADELKDAKPFLDAHGNQTTGNLGYDGTKLADDQPALYLLFNKYPTADLNELYLGPTTWFPA